ncbi:MAG: (d)CMP kinase [Burkholderiaceae bacterium]|nr:MAG: (d)CMP kinase [Burkholderiaceae bacterium]
MTSIPVITIDGPTASGKGTLAQQVATALGFHLLDSGALYRLVALQALRLGIPVDNIGYLTTLAEKLPVKFDTQGIWLDGENVSDLLRTEEVGNLASSLAVHAPVRSALVALQHSFRQAPGLVADGRDMGTVIFPDACLKVFLTASTEKRAERRYKQLIEKGFSANLAALLQDLKERDARDTQRTSAPLKPADDALLLDNSDLTISASVDQVLHWYQESRQKRCV